MVHKQVIDHRREKQRVKNYERWEGLRDEYDAQRRTTRSLDIQRTGQYDPTTNTWTDDAGSDHGRRSMDNDRGIFTLRDQQEANDARTSWRPQEAWDAPRTQMQAQMTGQIQQQPMPQMQAQGYSTPPQYMSTTPTMQTTGYMQPQQTGMSHLPLKSQKTGVTWDEDLPVPLQVSRRNFEDYDYNPYRRGSAPNLSISTSSSRDTSATRQGQGYGDQRANPSISNPNAASSRTHTPSGLRMESTPSPSFESQPQRQQQPQVIELPKNDFGFVEPAQMQSQSYSQSQMQSTTAAPGGRMAELIERGY